MKKYSLAIICISVLFVNVFALQGTIKDGYYISKNKHMTVAIPPIPNPLIVDGSQGPFQNVDFVGQKGNWMIGGAYSVEWFRYDPALSKSEVMQQIKALPEQMTLNGKNYNRQQDTMNCKTIFIAAKKTSGYQCINYGKEMDIPNVWIGTSFVMQGRLVNAYLKYPLLSKNPSNHNIPWADYNKFITSIQFP